MRSTFRAKLMAIVGIAGFAFLLLIIASALIARKVEEHLTTIQERYLPKVELEPELEAQLERIGRGFQDAVAAHDMDELGNTKRLEERFFTELAAAGDAVDPVETAALRASMDDYYSAAYDVSRRLIAGETGEVLVDAITAMQAKQGRADEQLKRTAMLDRGELSYAFADAARAERAAGSYRLVISLACLVSVVLLSFGLSRGVLRSLAELRSGFVRFGKGEFESPILVTSHDELRDVAEHANLMAANLERLGRERKKAEAALENSNRELEAFSYSVAHDLRAPLRGINGFSRALLDDYGDKLDDEAQNYLNRIAAGAERMGHLIDALLALSRVTRTELQRETVNLSRLADAVVKQLRAGQPDRTVDFILQEDVVAYGDSRLLRALLENLLGNAWKFTGARERGQIEFGVTRVDGVPVYFIQDNGAGFDMTYMDKLFTPFQRLHSTKDFAGTGIGLATVQRIVTRHEGRVWAEGAVDRGATFHFTLANAAGGTFS